MITVDRQSFIQLSRAIATHLSLPMTQEQLLVSLPEGKLTNMHIEQGLLNIDISASLQKNNLKQLILPALVADKDGGLLLITDKQKNTNKSVSFNVIGLTKDNAALSLSLANLTERGIQACWLIANKKLIQRRGNFVQKKDEHWLKPIFNEVKPYYSALLLGSFAVNLLALVIPLFTMNVYDRVVPNAAIDTLWALAIGATLAITFDFFLKQARTQLADVAGRKIDVMVSSSLFSKVIGMKLENRPQSSGAYAKQVQEFDSVREFLTSATLVSAIDLPFTLLFLALIAWLGGLMVLIPITTMVIILLTGMVLKNRLNSCVEESSKLATQKQAYLIEYINQIVEIKQCNAEGKSQRIWEQTVRQLSDWQNESRTIASSLTHTVMSMQQLTTIGLIIAGVYQIQAGNISMGALIAMVMISGRASSAISQISSLILKYKQTTDAMESVKTIMALPQELNDNVLGDELIISGNIRVNQVSFNYPEQKLAVLNNINLDINAGEKIGLYGNAGSGKSSLLALISGQYQPSQGQIFFDDIDLKQWPIASIRSHSAWVAQNPSLFYGSVLENIVQGCESINPNRLAQVIKQSGIAQFTDRLEDGLESQVGEFGRCLSGGQRQSILIARALLKESTIMFLDEPTSAMDENTERQIITSLKNIEQKTLFIASHKPAVLSLCDRIIVMEKGQITAIKTPQALFGTTTNTTARKVRSVSISPNTHRTNTPNVSVKQNTNTNTNTNTKDDN
ncbi:type I secretion system permease/ATPase [Colwellia sp. E2M01]|uniref:type I secretion system permease/ATPase n=1 Tax=Colwellia sp. E2M01 TaxID=2841561 RepID=UPI001C09BC12|nr:type I secretion system permease/ATPase [Colwellia sp. E2M01]MBU2871315.1 type I secretion system permease/ATPase [Colwellia sp. E2M01]